jgi:hypothetical protein
VAAAWQEIKTTCYSTAAQLRGLVVERFAGKKKSITPGNFISLISVAPSLGIK